MIRRPPRSTRTDTLFPYTTLFRSAEAMSDFLANAEDQIAGGTTFEEFAKDASLPIKATPLIVSGGASPQKPDYQPAPEISALLKPAFDMELDDDPQMVTVAPDQAYALLDVTDVKAAAPPQLERGHDRKIGSAAGWEKVGT